MEDQTVGLVQFPSKQRMSRYRNASGEEIVIPYRWNGEAHGPLLQVMERLRLKFPSKTYRTYGELFLNFDSYAEQHHGVKWDAPPDKVRAAYTAYLVNIGGASVDVDKKTETYLIKTDPAQLKRAASTLNLQHEAIRSVYKIAVELGLYRYSIDPLSRVVPDHAMRKPDMYRDAYIGKPLYRERDPSRIYRFADNKWVPALLMEDMKFSAHLREAFENPKLKIKSQHRCILELLLTSGMRLGNEACGASLQGWALPNSKGLSFQTSMLVANKGDGEAQIKSVSFPPAVAQRLRAYFEHDRPKLDPDHDEFVRWAKKNKLPPKPTPERYFQFVSHTDDERLKLDPTAKRSRTPLFLSQKGAPYRDSIFRQEAWQPALAAAEPPIKARPHQTRHWFTTLILIRIEQIYRLDRPKYRAARQSFGKYMRWKNIEAMLEKYDQALEKHGMKEQWPLIAQFAESQLAASTTDFQAFIHDIEAPTAEELKKQSAVRTAFAAIEGFIESGDDDE